MFIVRLRDATTSRRRMLLLSGLVSILWLSAPAKSPAAAQDYKFQLAAPITRTGTGVLVKIRLIRISDGKPVSGAVVFETKLDMAPEGMATMTAPIKSVPATDPAVYQFEGQPPMAGNWAIELAAKVQGEVETVRGSVNIAVPK